MDEPNVKVKSLAKALNVLNCFIQEPELGVTEISERLGLYKSNVCDILTTFQSLGYVDQSERTGKYHLGYRILELSHAFTTSMGFRKTIYPHMKQLADEVGETVYLGVPDGLDVLYLDAAYPGHEYMTRAMLGDRAPMYCTGIGKAILSQLDEATWASLFSQKLKPYTNSTLTDPEKLRQDLLAARERKYAVDNMEHEYGIRCVGVPILNGSGRAVAGISISCPSLRMDDEKVKEYAACLQQITENISIYF